MQIQFPGLCGTRSKPDCQFRLAINMTTSGSKGQTCHHPERHLESPIKTLNQEISLVFIEYSYGTGTF